MAILTHRDDSAFPNPGSQEPGLTKREYFAALNHAAILSNAAFNQGAEDMMHKAGIKTEHIEAFLAGLAVQAADALIRELQTR